MFVISWRQSLNCSGLGGKAVLVSEGENCLHSDAQVASSVTDTGKEMKLDWARPQCCSDCVNTSEVGSRCQPRRAERGLTLGASWQAKCRAATRECPTAACSFRTGSSHPVRVREAGGCSESGTEVPVLQQSLRIHRASPLIPVVFLLLQVVRHG